ncbi:hypothetical protein ACJMK2_001918 [Sinanodonta woodiana]|uniref:Uncharacterized protein n=1 Tax=Sinanodonta woodiana TaxID=1069815 RepID=A0ABD3XTR7_SINWO
MRKQEQDSWIIYILLIEYVVSINTCERGTSLGELKFGYFLPRSAFTTKYQVSSYQCAIECHLRIHRCKSFNYRRSDLSCQLCEEDSGPGGNNLQPKAGSIHSNIDTWRNLPIEHCNTIHCLRTEKCDSSKQAGENTCVPAECPFAELKLGMTIKPSNETAVGTKARRRCMSNNMERGDPITTCLENEAKWSNPDFKCVCINPPEKSGTQISTSEVEIGQNFTYQCKTGLVAKRGQNPTVTCLTDGSWSSTMFTCVCNTPQKKYGAINEMAEIEVGQNYSYKCQSGLFEKGDLNQTSTCLENGTWTSIHFQCVRQNWQQETIYYNNMHTSDLIRNVTGIDLLECMRQCNDNWTNCLSFFYDNHLSQCSLSSSFRRGLPQYLPYYDGLVYYTAPSNSCDMGYMNVSLKGSNFCFKAYSIVKTFNQAMEICESEKAKLAVITTDDQISDLRPHLPVGKQIYVGISDGTKEGIWVGWDGKAVNLTWSPFEPNGGINENCGVINPYGIGVYDESCAWNLYFLCSKF